MWGSAAFGALALAGAVAGARGQLPWPIGLFAIAVFLVCIVLAGWFGFRGQRQALAAREHAAWHQMVVLLTAELAKQDSSRLREIAARGGAAGAAAAMLLEGRAEEP